MNAQLLTLSMFMRVANTSTHACWHSGRHLLAFEKDTIMFNTILAPLLDPTPTPLIGHLQSSNIVVEDDKEPI